MDASFNYFTVCIEKKLEQEHMGTRPLPLPPNLLKHASLFFATFTIPMAYGFSPILGN
jgi:hypothetical protein